MNCNALPRTQTSAGSRRTSILSCKYRILQRFRRMSRAWQTADDMKVDGLIIIKVIKVIKVTIMFEPERLQVIEW